MRYLLIFLSISASISFLAQNSTCDKKSLLFHKEKSNTLPLNYIQETEKYNVTFYELDLIANNMNTNLEGSVKMSAIANEDLDTVVFELFPTYSIDYLLFNLDTVKFARRNTGIHCDVNLKKGEQFIITTHYSGKAPTQTTNPLGGSGYNQKLSTSWGKNVSWTLSEPFSAYEWFPCKQSLTDKIDSVTIKITVPDSCMAGSNGLLQKITNLPNNQKQFEWKHRQAIDYYLISFCVANYTDYSIYAHPKNIDSVLVQNYVYPNFLDSFKNQLNNTTKFIEYYSDIYSTYPFYKEKYGHCLAPIGGGMEHQTMTTLGDFDNELVAHELAHQWWGDHVTCGSWSDIWLNEGFATYSEYLMLANFFPGNEVVKMNNIHTSALSVNEGSVWVKDSLNEKSIFSRQLVYDKGAAIIHTLRYIVNNDKLFFKALRDFQTNFSFNTATVKDFKKSMENSTNLDFTNFFNEWYYGEGFPIYAAQLFIKQDNSCELVVTHKGSAQTKTPIFTNPIDLRISRTNNTDTIIRVEINSNLQKIDLPSKLGLKEVIDIDPYNYIVNQVEQFTNQIDTISDAVLVYPNPTQDLITIEVKNPVNATLKLISIDGKTILEKSFLQKTQLNIQNQSIGNYILIIENKDVIYKQKITKN